MPRLVSSDVPVYVLLRDTGPNTPPALINAKRHKTPREAERALARHLIAQLHEVLTSDAWVAECDVNAWVEGMIYDPEVGEIIDANGFRYELRGDRSLALIVPGEA